MLRRMGPRIVNLDHVGIGKKARSLAGLGSTSFERGIDKITSLSLCFAKQSPTGPEGIFDF